MTVQLLLRMILCKTMSDISSYYLLQIAYVTKISHSIVLCWLARILRHFKHAYSGYIMPEIV